MIHRKYMVAHGSLILESRFAFENEAAADNFEFCMKSLVLARKSEARQRMKQMGLFKAIRDVFSRNSELTRMQKITIEDFQRIHAYFDPHKD